MKEFFQISIDKVILSLGLYFLAPLPFYAIAVVGFAPPATLFMLMHGAASNGTFSLIILVFILLSYVVTYLLSCVLSWIISKITPDEIGKRNVALLVVIALLILSFADIYYLGDIGGGRHSGNIVDLYSGRI